MSLFSPVPPMIPSAPNVFIEYSELFLFFKGLFVDWLDLLSLFGELFYET